MPLCFISVSFLWREAGACIEAPQSCVCMCVCAHTMCRCASRESVYVQHTPHLLGSKEDMFSRASELPYLRSFQRWKSLFIFALTHLLVFPSINLKIPCGPLCCLKFHQEQARNTEQDFAVHMRLLPPSSNDKSFQSLLHINRTSQKNNMSMSHLP